MIYSARLLSGDSRQKFIFPFSLIRSIETSIKLITAHLFCETFGSVAKRIPSKKVTSSTAAIAAFRQIIICSATSVLTISQKNGPIDGYQMISLRRNLRLNQNARGRVMSSRILKCRLSSYCFHNAVLGRPHCRLYRRLSVLGQMIFDRIDSRDDINKI